MEGNKRIPYLDFLKVIALICIILAHVSPPGPVFMLRNFDVVLMIVISAILGGVSYRKRANREVEKSRIKTYISYFISRFKRLVLPTWILITVYFAYQLVIGNVYGVKKYLASYMLTRYGMSYVWIVLIFLYTALLIPAYCRYEKKKKTVFAVLAILYAIYEVVYFLGLGVDNKLLNCTVFYIIPYGLITFLGVNYNEFSDRTKKVVVGSSVFVFLAFFVFYYFNTGSIQDVQIAKYPPRAYYLSYGLAVSYGLLYFCEHCCLRVYENKLIRFISVHSLGIYLCHVMVLEFYKLLRLPQNWIVEWVVVFSASLGAVWIWSEAKRKGKACVTGLISLILVFCLSASIFSYKGIFMNCLTKVHTLNLMLMGKMLKNYNFLNFEKCLLFSNILL